MHRAIAILSDIWKIGRSKGTIKRISSNKYTGDRFFKIILAVSCFPSCSQAGHKYNMYRYVYVYHENRTTGTFRENS